MNSFSEESLLLVQNWDTVEDILRSETRLRTELESVLHGVLLELEQQDWWQNGWIFDKSQAHIWNHHWQSGADHAISIGIENFAPNTIFGMDPPPILYVWVSGGRKDLAHMLAEKIQESGKDLLGEIDTKASGYVVRQSVAKCPPGELQCYRDLIRSQILDFFGHYAKVLWALDADVRSYLGME